MDETASNLIQAKEKEITEKNAQYRPYFREIMQLEEDLKELKATQNIKELKNLRGCCFKGEESLIKYLNRPLYDNSQAHILIVDFYHPNILKIELELRNHPRAHKDLIEITNDEFYAEIIKQIKEYDRAGFFDDETK